MQQPTSMGLTVIMVVEHVSATYFHQETRKDSRPTWRIWKER
jgi:hypothetical protein